MSDSRFAFPARVVLITGATSGIGRACAEHLAAAGWRVFATGRSVRSASIADGRIEFVEMNVDDEASVHGAVATVIAKAGRLDAVVNNAGFALMGAVEDTDISEARAIFETNFFGVLRVCRATLPALRANGGGYIVNIGSLAGVVGLPFGGLYSASKFALEGMSESLRLETRPFGIHVVMVEPGDFRTQIMANRQLAASSQSGLYRAAFDKFMHKRRQDEANAPTPEPVARLVERILNDRGPKMRYAVGKYSQRIVIPLKRFLPQQIFEWSLRLFIGL
jgi:NAD(P)-dependent dehydrogenase (short-subunit alcohol dehydrogenase family)